MFGDIGDIPSADTPECYILLPKSDASTMEPSIQQPRKRQRRTNACEECRYRKVKCSQQRPSCAQCIAQGATCEYREVPPRRNAPVQTSDNGPYTPQSCDMSTASLPLKNQHPKTNDIHALESPDKIHGTVSKTRLQSNGHWNAFARVSDVH